MQNFTSPYGEQQQGVVWSERFRVRAGEDVKYPAHAREVPLIHCSVGPKVGYHMILLQIVFVQESSTVAANWVDSYERDPDRVSDNVSELRAQAAADNDR